MRLIDTAKARRTSFMKQVFVPTKVVAFTDPNDLLSYELSPDEYAGRDVVNVRASNAATYFGVVELPNEAHRDYRNNPDVRNLIECGRNVPGSDLCLKQESPF